MPVVTDEDVLDALRQRLEGDGPEADAAVDDDIRTLAVDYNEHGDRWKSWRTVSGEMRCHSFADWARHLPEGVMASAEMLKIFERMGGGTPAGGCKTGSETRASALASGPPSRCV